MNIRDEQLVARINKYYQELLDEMKMIHNSFEKFQSKDLKDLAVSKAVDFELLQISECVSNLTDEAKSKISGSNLSGIKQIRNRVVYGYGSLDSEIIRNTIQTQLPKLIEEVNSIN